jgi:hypothetical protein
MNNIAMQETNTELLILDLKFSFWKGMKYDTYILLFTAIAPQSDRWVH